jgi:hypothetical protein
MVTWLLVVRHVTTYLLFGGYSVANHAVRSGLVPGAVSVEHIEEV